jgi:hypothetical protein
MTQQYTLVLPIKVNSYSHSDLQRFIHIQLRSLNKFLDSSSVCEFLIICKKNEIDIVKKALIEHPSPLPIQLLSEDLIVTEKVINNTSGWYLQQLLKLGIAKIIKTPLYLILDADCFLTKPFSYKDLFHEGKIIIDKICWTHNPGWWLDSMKIIEEVSLHELSAQLAMAVTPQILVTEVVCQLVDYLNHKEALVRWDEYLSLKKFTEYSLYWLFLIKLKKLDLYQLANGPSLLSNALWWHLLRVTPPHKNIFSRAWKRISKRQRKKGHMVKNDIIMNFKTWSEKQIQASFESNTYFHFTLIQSSIDEIPVEWIIEQTNKYLS